jgi:hypothetical protein
MTASSSRLDFKIITATTNIMHAGLTPALQIAYYELCWREFFLPAPCVRFATSLCIISLFVQVG